MQVTAATSGTLSTPRTLTGTVAAAQTTTVTARTSGTVTGVLASVGAAVKAGQTVVTLSNTDLNSAVQSAQNALDSAQVQLRGQQSSTVGARAGLQAQVTAAQLSLTNAQATLSSQQQLLAIGAVARSEVTAQQAAVAAAQTTLTTARANLAENERSGAQGVTEARLSVQRAQLTLTQARAAADAARVTAPFAGQITALNVAPGEYLTANGETFTLVSNQRQVNVNVPATEAASLTPGTVLSFTSGSVKYPLKVAQNPGAPTGGSVPLVARFTGESIPALGSVGSVVYTAKVASGVLVPSTALQADGDQTYVFTVSGSKASLSRVTVLGQAGTQSAVSGIPSGAQVVTQPPTGLLDGANVSTASGAASSGAPAGGPPPGGQP